MDPYALTAWCCKVLADANEARPPVSYKPGTVTLDFLGQVARLSWSNEGPRLAREFLAKHDQAVTWMLSPGFITCTFTLGAMEATAARNSSPAWGPSTCALWA